MEIVKTGDSYVLTFLYFPVEKLHSYFHPEYCDGTNDLHFIL